MGTSVARTRALDILTQERGTEILEALSFRVTATPSAEPPEDAKPPTAHVSATSKCIFCSAVSLALAGGAGLAIATLLEDKNFAPLVAASAAATDVDRGGGDLVDVRGLGVIFASPEPFEEYGLAAEFFQAVGDDPALTSRVIDS